MALHIRTLPILCALLLSGAAPAVLAQDQDDDDFFVFDDDDGAENTTSTIADPLEGFNRVMFTVNDKLYRGVLKPVARGLRILPEPMRIGAANFFANLRTPMSAISALLQGDLRNAGSETGRFLLNTTVGVLGLLDPATEVGLVKDEHDLGQTLGKWGVGHGAYLVLPFVGSSSLREFPGMIATSALNPVYGNAHSDTILAANLVSAPVSLSLDKDTYEAFYDSALDPYVFFRSAWVQNRAGRVAK
ncbi:MAG: VacJ family lipoprotein [Pseudomonadales bacterium]|jgi:phospholipid-binding lipoprotein MlaA|nr:VacJ family lipoprotein [Pseudomonadales bacterium]